MDALLTPETLSKSRPPASFPAAAAPPLASVENVAGGARKGVSGALMQERQRLDEENRSLRKALDKAERARACGGVAHVRGFRSGGGATRGERTRA